MSINPEYSWYCPEHDEDLYLFETCYLVVYKKGEENGEESGEMNFDDITTAEYIELFNLMNNRYTQGNRLVFPNTNGAITTEFKDFKDFAARVCNGDYHSGDSWCQINAHGNITTFTELEDSEINVLHIKEWLERSQENRDLANTKLGKKRF